MRLKPKNNRNKTNGQPDRNQSTMGQNLGITRLKPEENRTEIRGPQDEQVVVSLSDASDSSIYGPSFPLTTNVFSDAFTRKELVQIISSYTEIHNNSYQSNIVLQTDSMTPGPIGS
ncbi:hypothetical protein GOODEAATRI_026311 [Goodea atripinnis]|uniref:Uncharacterized protein n=1 Tax=Goodea atripinnis TaxID=208336 RepID=A0ABV0Q166_9TELE